MYIFREPKKGDKPFYIKIFLDRDLGTTGGTDNKKMFIKSLEKEGYSGEPFIITWTEETRPEYIKRIIYKGENVFDIHPELNRFSLNIISSSCEALPFRLKTKQELIEEFGSTDNIYNYVKDFDHLLGSSLSDGFMKNYFQNLIYESEYNIYQAFVSIGGNDWYIPYDLITNAPYEVVFNKLDEYIEGIKASKKLREEESDNIILITKTKHFYF